MKKVFLLVVCLGCAAVSYAQSSLSKGSSLVNVGVGVVPGFGGNASYDYGLIDHWGPGLFTVGGYFSTSVRNKNYGFGKYEVTHKETKLFFAPRASYRYSINPKFEIFGSMMIGLLVINSHEDVDQKAAFGLMAGCRYFFTNSFGVFAEGGANIDATCLNGGICFSF
ncbi:MAG: hypothetical protein LBV39_01390 [Bacteroidales bacterium]|jgi:hypothetical protein|nr:hypothetical protein [Bacteroidales bacterium]